MGFAFYDVEATGTHAAFDQILQFAAVRTDNELQPTERFETGCRLLPSVVPSPAILYPSRTLAARLIDPSLPTHYDMVRQIYIQMAAWSPAVFLTHNAIAFGERLLRQSLYKTLHPPYLTNTKGNCRSDVLRMLQATSLLAPNALALPLTPTGQVDFDLERVASANGFCQVNARGAMRKVETTIFLCRLVLERAPDVWSMFMRFSQKAAVADFVSNEAVFSHSDFFFERPYSWLVTSIGTNPDNTSEFIVYNLAINPATLSAMSDVHLQFRLGQTPKPLRRLRGNGSPILLPAEDAPPISAGLALGMEELDHRAQMLRADKSFCERLITTFQSLRSATKPSPYVEEQLYDRFFTQGDQDLMEAFHLAVWDQRLGIVLHFEDPRLQYLGLQLIHSERPDLLSAPDRREHERVSARRVCGIGPTPPWLTLPRAIQQIDELLVSAAAEEEALLRAHQRQLVERLDKARAFLA
jgi:exodeoxyribonuclease-1